MSTTTAPARRSGLDRALTTVENLAAGLSLVAAVTVALLAVVLRELFDVYLFWTEEVIIYLVISSTFFGAVLTLRSKEHVNVDIIGVFLARRGRRVMAIIAAVVTVLYLLAVGSLAWMLILEPFSRSIVTPALKLPLWVVELPVAIALTLMFLHSLELLAHAWKHGADETSAADVAIAEAEAAGISAEDVSATRGAAGAARVPGDPTQYVPPRPGRGEHGVPREHGERGEHREHPDPDRDDPGSSDPKGGPR